MQENVETARRVFDALNQADLPGAMSEMATDFAFDFSRSMSPDRGVYGREDLAGLRDAFTGVWESVRYEPEEFIEAGDQLVTPVTTHNRGRQGIEVETRTAWIWSFSDGRVARVTFFQDRRAALESVGLSE